MGIFADEVKMFCEAALTSGYIKRSEDIQLLSEYPNTLISMVNKECGGDIEYIPRTEEELKIHIQSVKTEKELLLRSMDDMIAKGLPILEKLNEMQPKIPDVFEQLKSFEE
eukprot:NODE_77_length_23338_cov_0.319463.p14 type:complete len:111 gc:universal NODE_77_length_23338_cov_0.319463:3066-3398(+)